MSARPLNTFGVALLAVLALPGILPAQGTRWSEAAVNSDWELYIRAYAIRGLISDEPWTIRPFTPRVLDRWRATIPAANPWNSRLPQRAAPDPMFQVVRPLIEVSDNSAYAWGFHDGPVWQGRGLNAWATAGAAWHWGHFSARFEPLMEVAQNAAFPLQSLPAGSANSYLNPQMPHQIDFPQRMGGSTYRIFDPGNSYIRFDAKSFGAGFSTETFFWGPGLQNAILFDGNAAGFPHLFFGTNQAVATPVGRFNAQVVYGRLEQSDWAPSALESSRLGAGVVATWQPPRTPITLGIARFYHRFWPSHWTKSDYLLPFGAFFSRPSAFSLAPNQDNQLVSAFFSARAQSVGLEVHGEFGRNDRNVDLRDLALEPEHASAWLLGFVKVVGLDSTADPFWEIRAEVADARTGPTGPGITPRPGTAVNFYSHSPITQGHTERGQLLGTPLIARSIGAEVNVDRFSRSGRLGISLMERQMPADLAVGMPADSARSQWDLGFGGTLFHGASDVTFKIGHVWDLNRFAGQDVGNFYILVGTKIGW